jgi:hypothetical protein
MTQHWLRHRLPTLTLRKGPAHDDGIRVWLDSRSVIGYSHDVPEYRRQLVGEKPEAATPQRR